MRDREASRTMVNTAILRAAHQVLDDNPKILADPIAVGLVPEASIGALKSSALELSSPELTLRRASMVLRSRYTEDRLAAAFTRGVRQYVIIAAGLDTFAWRQPMFARRLRIFSVDMPASQAFARDRLAAQCPKEPANLTFVPLDLEHGTLASALSAGGVDFDKPVFFSVLGLSQYLTNDAFSELLRHTASAAPGSETVMSIHPPPAALAEPSRNWLKQTMRRCSGLGEPWLNLVTPIEALARLTEAGFSHVDHLTTAEAQSRYFSGRRDGLAATDATQMIVGQT